MKKVLSGILYIDATAYEQVVFVLDFQGKKHKKEFEIGSHGGHKIVGRLQVFLKPFFEKGLKVSRVLANAGPGSFVGTRVGVTIAQALAVAWKVKAESLPADEFFKKLAI